MIIYIVNDNINIIYKEKVLSLKFMSIKDGFIVNREKFIFEFLREVKNNKIKGKLLGDKINIVKESFYSISDLYFLENLFLEMGFIKVKFLNIKEYFKEFFSYIEINDNYMVINFDKGLYLNFTYYKNIEKIIEYFKDSLKKDVILFGTNEKITKIRIRGLNIYYLDNKERYIIESLLKVKK